MKPDFFLLALKVSTGIGKTEQVLRAIAERPDLRGVMLVPRHKLTDELLLRCRALGIEAGSWRGREARNPAAGDGSMMCIELEIYEAAKRADLVEEACKACPSRSRCPFFVANDREPARLEIAANNFLFGKPPVLVAGKRNKVDVLIIDEAFIDKRVDDGRTLLIDALTSPPTSGTMAMVDVEAARAPLRRALRAAFADGRLLKRHLIAEGITADICRQGEACEWAAKPKAPKLDGVGAEDLVGTLRKYAGRFDNRPALLWRALGQFLAVAEDEEAEAGAIEMVTASTDGGDAPAVRFRIRRELHETWRGIPTLVLDAETLPSNEELEALFGRKPERVEVAAEVPAAVRVHQLVDPMPTSALVDRDGAAKPKLADVADRIEVLARQYAGQGRDGGDVLAVGGTAAIADRLREALEQRGLDVAPKGGSRRRHAVEVRHCGDLAGEDAYGGVRALVQVGWPLPPARALERAVGAATGIIPTRMPGEAWAMAPGGLRLRDGSGYRVQRPIHPEPAVEELRRRKTEGAMAQGLGRARWSRRDTKTPSDIWTLSPLPVPGMVVDRVLRWREVAVRRLELAFWRAGGVLPCRPADLLRTRLWPSEVAAEKDLKRDISFIDSLIKGMSPFEVTPARYRRVNQSRWSRALVGAWLAPEAAVQRLRVATGVDNLIVELGEPAARPATFAAAVAAIVEAGVAPVGSAGAGPLLASMLPAAFPTPQDVEAWLASIPAKDRVFTLPEAALGRDWRPERAYLNHGSELVPVDVLVAADARAGLVQQLRLGAPEAAPGASPFDRLLFGRQRSASGLTCDSPLAGLEDTPVWIAKVLNGPPPPAWLNAAICQHGMVRMT